MAVDNNSIIVMSQRNCDGRASITMVGEGPGYQKPKKRNLRNWCNPNYKSVIQLRTRNCTCVIGPGRAKMLLSWKNIRR